MQPDENKEKELSIDNDMDEETEESEEQEGLLSRLLPKKQEKTKKETSVDVQRIHADTKKGLTSAQVQERLAKGYVNKTKKRFSKTYWSIIKDNLCTFFNLMCLVAAIALILAHAPISQFGFIPIFSFNIIRER